MPLREYRCKECGEVVEVLSLDPDEHDGPPDQCPSCGFWNALELMISQSSVHFLGDGWTPKGLA